MTNPSDLVLRHRGPVECLKVGDLEIHGLDPSNDVCGICGDSFAHVGEWAVFVEATGAAVCGSCLLTHAPALWAARELVSETPAAVVDLITRALYLTAPAFGGSRGAELLRWVERKEREDARAADARAAAAPRF